MSLTLRTVTKALETFYSSNPFEASPNVGLPSNLIDLINELLATPNTDYSKLHEDLLRLHKVSKDHKVPDAAFLESLALLAPKLVNANHLEQWYKAYVNPAINCAGYRNDVVKASQKLFLAVMEHGTGLLSKPQMDNGDSVLVECERETGEKSENSAGNINSIIVETPSDLFFFWVFELYQGTISKYFDLKESGLNLAERKRFIMKIAKELLVQFGSVRPVQFFTNLTKKAGKPENRLSVLCLASNLVGEYHKMDFSALEETPFPQFIYNCLLNDRSSTTIQMSINVLSMYLPHIRTSLDLPTIFAIFGRTACWYSHVSIDAESAMADDEQEVLSKDVLQNQPHSISSNWKVLNRAFGLPDVRTADVSPLFLVLYGLYPYNTLEYSRNPSGYMASLKYPNPLPENWDDFQISRTMELLFPQYSLNPFMLKYTKEQEINDPNRSGRFGDTRSLVVHCLSLRVQTFQSPESPEPGNENEISNTPTERMLVNPFNAKERMRPYSFPTSEISVGPQSLTTWKGLPPMSPTLRDVSSVLEEHQKLYKRKGSDSSIPEITDYSDSLRSPTFVPPTEPSLSTTSVTVSSPLIHSIKPDELEPSRLSLSTNLDNLGPSTVQDRIQDQQLIGSKDPNILFYQRELILLRNEFDFLKYMERHSQYQHSLLLEQRAKDAIYSDNVNDLVSANQMLRKKLYRLEMATSEAQKRMKTMQVDRQKYEYSLLQRNRDLRSSHQEISRKLTKLNSDMEALQKENKQLLNSIIDKETKISHMEFKLTDVSQQAALADTYRQALADADEKVVQLEGKTASFLSPEDADQVSNFLVRIKELTMQRDATEMNRQRETTQFRRQIVNLQAQVRSYQEKQKNPSRKLMQGFEDFQHQADKQYQELLNAYQDISERYADVNDEFRKYITAEEIELRNKSIHSPSFPKSLLGYDISPPQSSSGRTSSRSSTSLSNQSLTGGNRIHSPQPPLHNSQFASQTLKVSSKRPQSEQHVRIRGRGGVQSTIRRKDSQNNLPAQRTGTGPFRAFK